MTTIPSRTLTYDVDHESGLQIPVTEITLAPSPDGTPNEPVRVYRTDGPACDPNHGLPDARTEWIAERGDTEEYAGREPRPESPTTG
jgi:phosphomethylpyrimidine synthase